MRRKPLPVPENLLQRRRPMPNGCIEYTGGVNHHGYGLVWVGGPNRLTTTAHRAMWMHVNGPIPDGLVVDHLCRNRLCVNIDHLRLLTNNQNTGHIYKTECPKGHPYTEHNLDEHAKALGKRRCRTCKNDYMRGYNARRTAK